MPSFPPSLIAFVETMALDKKATAVESG